MNKAIVLTLAVALPLLASEKTDCTDPRQVGDCTKQDLIKTYGVTGAPDPWPIEAYLAARDAGIVPAAVPISQRFLPEVPPPPSSQAEVTDLAKRPTVALSPVQPTAGVHAAQQNFVTPLAFALSSVEPSEDGQALLVRGNGSIASVTAAVYKVENAFAEAVNRTAQGSRDTLKKQLQDFDDWSIALSRSVDTSTCSFDRLKASDCYGRNPDQYQNALATLLFETLLKRVDHSDIDNATLRELIEPIDENERRALASPSPDTAAAINPKLKDVDRSSAERFVQKIRVVQAVNAGLGARERAGDKLTKLLATLIQHQPQFSLSATWRDRDPLVGRRQWGATAEYDVGFDNLNSRLKGCSRDECKALTATDVSPNNFSLTAAYQRVMSYALAIVPKAVGTDLAPFSLPAKSSWTLSTLWSRELRAQGLTGGDRNSNLSVKVDYTHGDPDVKGTTGVATLTLPVGKDLNLPISLRYGSRTALIGDVKKRVSMHFGITYQLPFGK